MLRSEALIAANSILLGVAIVLTQIQYELWTAYARCGLFYVTVFAGEILLVAIVLTCFRSIHDAFKSDVKETEARFGQAYKLFWLALFFMSVFVLFGPISWTIQVWTGWGGKPIDWVLSIWGAAILFALLIVYVLVLILEPKWLSNTLRFKVLGVLTRLRTMLLDP